jgi:hypothetical protein
MRTLSTLLLSLVMVMTSTASVPPDSLNAAAAKAYLAGDHATALVHYTALLEFGISSDLYYNIGNCHYKLGDIAQATLHYERALKLAPGDEDLRANLELARARSKDRVNELPGSSLLAQWNRLAGGRDPRSLGKDLVVVGYRIVRSACDHLVPACHQDSPLGPDHGRPFGITCRRCVRHGQCSTRSDHRQYRRHCHGAEGGCTQ